MELPIVLANPALDIVLISVLFNLFAYGAYAYLFKKEFSKIASIDIRLSIVTVLVVMLNYYGTGTIIEIYGFTLEWWLWYILISIPIEIIFFLSYKQYFGLSWEEIAGSGYKK